MSVKQSLAQKKRFQRPEEREKVGKALKGRIAWNVGLTAETDEGVRKQGRLGHQCTEETKEKMRISSLGCTPWNVGLTKETDFRVKGHTEEWKEKARQWSVGNCSNKGRTKETDEGMRRHAESMVGNKFSEGNYWPQERREKYQEMFSGEKNPSYIDGRSFVLYPSDFDEKLRERIRERDGHICQKCGCPEYPERKLDVHHIDEDPRNNLEQNLISLHMDCHLVIRKNRIFWKKFFQDVLSLGSRESIGVLTEPEVEALGSRRRLVTLNS